MDFWIIEGNSHRLDGGAMFGQAPRELWKQWEEPDALNRIGLATRALLMRTDAGQLILFEAGIGNFFDEKLRRRYGVEDDENRLLANLEKAGFNERDIDAVVLSHLHFDHAGGLLPSPDDDTLTLHFPHAKYYVSARHFKHAQAPHIRERASYIPLLQELLQGSGRLVLVEGETHPDLCEAGISFEYSDGHTIGLMLSWITTPRGDILVASDLIPGRHWVHLPITLGYDRFAELKIDEKQRIMTKLLSKNDARVFLMHDTATPCIAITQEEDGKFGWQSASLPHGNGGAVPSAG